MGHLRWLGTMALAFVVSQALVGCPGAVDECTDDSACGAGKRCDLATNLCVEVPGGGDCSSACAAHQQCVEDMCLARYSAVVLEQPADGAHVAPGGSVTAQARLELVSGRTANAPENLTLEVTAPGGMTSTVMLERSAEVYEGEVVLGSAEGEYRLVAKYVAAGLESAPVVVQVDGTAPGFEVALPDYPVRRTPADGTRWTDEDAAYAGSFRRDEVATVHVWSEDADVAVGTVELTAQFPNSAAKTYAVEATDVSECPAQAAYCGKVALSLWEVEMNAFRAELTLSVSGEDVAGNAGSSGEARLKVTRWKWVHEASTTEQIKASPAVASDGTIVFGTSAGNSGKLVALNHDGSVKWENALGAVVASPAIGSTDTVYFAANGSGGANLYAAPLATGVPSANCAAPSGQVEVSPVVTQTQYSADTSPVETAVVVTESGNNLFSVRPTGTCPFPDDAGGSATFPNTLVSKGGELYFGDADGNVRSFSFSNGWTARTGWPISGSAFTRSLAIGTGDVVGGGAAATAIFAIPLAGGTPWTHAASAQAWNPVIAAGDRAWVGLNDQNLMLVTLKNAASSGSTVETGVVQAAPVLGESDRLFTAGKDGSVVARKQSTPESKLWSVSGLGVLESSPNIDCTRDEATGNKVPGAPGVLYVGSNSGRLYAFIVDARGIDTSAPWPKYQHDPRNTGNADTPLSEFSCP